MILLESFNPGARRNNSPKITLEPRAGITTSSDSIAQTVTMHFQDPETGRCYNLTLSAHDAEVMAARLIRAFGRLEQ